MDDVQQVIALELALLTADVRGSAKAAELLDPEFVEIGASGRLWPREEILELLGQEPTGPAIEATELSGRQLADDLVLLTYVSDRAGRRARRSSLWRLGPTGWRMLHHQGTPLPA